VRKATAAEREGQIAARDERAEMYDADEPVKNASGATVIGDA